MFRDTQFFVKFPSCYCCSQVMEELLNILGPELKTVTGDSKSVDKTAARVRDLRLQFDDVNFDIFSQEASEKWKAVSRGSM